MEYIPFVPEYFAVPCVGASMISLSMDHLTVLGAVLAVSVLRIVSAGVVVI